MLRGDKQIEPKDSFLLGGEKVTKKNQGPGRQSKWDEVKERLAEIEIWLRDGLTEAQVCKNLGIAVSTFNTYKSKYPELVTVIKKGKETQIIEVENALFKNATGYYFYVDEAIKVKDAEGGERIEKIRLQKFKGPDTGAIAFFLKNKDKSNWTDNPQMIDIKREELKIRQNESEFKAW